MIKKPIGYYYNKIGDSKAKVKIFSIRSYAKENFSPMFANSALYARDAELYYQVQIEFLGIPENYAWVNVLKSDIIIENEEV